VSVKNLQCDVADRARIRRLVDRVYAPGRWRNRAAAGIVLPLLVIIMVGLSGCSVDQAPSGPTPTSALPNVTHDYNTAVTLQNNGHCDRAVPLYLKAINENAMYINAYTGLASCYQTLGSFNAAIAEYNKAIPIDPRNFNLYYLRAGAEFSLGMNGQAQADYSQALRLAPPERDTYVSIANGFTNFADFNDAFAAMAKAIALSPNDPSLYETRGGMYLAAKEYTNAYNDYKKAISLAPFNATQSSINVALAQAYAGQSDYNSAFSYMQTAINLQPSNPHLYVLSAGIHVAAGHYTAAIGLYEKVFGLVSRGDDVRAAHQGIGDVLATEGKTTAAIAEYKQAMHFTKDRATLAVLKANIKAAQQAAQS